MNYEMAVMVSSAFHLLVKDVVSSSKMPNTILFSCFCAHIVLKVSK